MTNHPGSIYLSKILAQYESHPRPQASINSIIYIPQTNFTPMHDPDGLTRDWQLIGPPLAGRVFHFVHQTKSGPWNPTVRNRNV